MSATGRLCSCLVIVGAVAMPSELSAMAAVPSGATSGFRAPTVAVPEELPAPPPVASEGPGPEEGQNTGGVVAVAVLVGGWAVAVFLSLARSRQRLRRAQ